MNYQPTSSLSIIRKILATLFCGVSSSSGSLTMDPTWTRSTANEHQRTHLTDKSKSRSGAIALQRIPSYR